MKKWIENKRFNFSNGIYDIVPVHNKVLIFSYFSISEYFKEESNNERININKDKNIIGGQRYKKSDKIQNIANELEKVMFPKSKS